MADVKWIKIATDIFDDEKILLIESLPEADTLITIWFKLLCLAGKQNNSGVFLMNDKIPYTDKMLATIFRRKESSVQLALTTFQNFGMVEIVDNVITIPNWSKHQSLDQLEYKKEYMKNYMKEYRDKQKALISPKKCCKTNNKTNSKANVSSLDIDIDKELDKEIDIDRESKENVVSQTNNTPTTNNSRNVFLKPTIDEIKNYCLERNNNINPERFFDFYETKNWMVGKNKMKDWKACIRTWEQRDSQEKPKRRIYKYEEENSKKNVMDGMDVL